MVTTRFQHIADRAMTMSFDEETEEAKTWYKEQVSKVRHIMDKKNIRTSITPANIGQMFLFSYNPKHKDTLPYYDIFPLVFPISFHNRGFLGINLHYLSITMRAQLMNALYATINNKKYDQTTRLKINYDLLNSVSSMRYFKPCLKSYLFGHVVQRYLYIDPNNWNKALMLPMERFVKKPKQFVHAESSNSIKG